MIWIFLNKFVMIFLVIILITNKNLVKMLNVKFLHFIKYILRIVSIKNTIRLLYFLDFMNKLCMTFTKILIIF